MFRLTSKGIERVDPPLIKSETKHILSTKTQLRSASNSIKAEPKEELMECKPSVMISERSRRNLEVIPKKERLVETNSVPETDGRSTNNKSRRYNLRRKSKPMRNSLFEDASDSDRTEDYQPEPESISSRPVKDRRFKCEFCSKAYTAKQNLNRHIIDTHVVDKDFQEEPVSSQKLKNSKSECEFCSRTFGSLWHLERHIGDAHVVDKDFKCLKCGRAFVSKTRLDSHVADRHERLKCTYCSVTYRMERNLQKHMEEHEKSGDPYNYKPFKCETCGKGFTSKSNKAKHELSHGNNKPHKCDHCPKTFVKRQNLGQHVANHHGGEKPYKCPHCPQKFFLERDLIKYHLPYHFEDRNFECDKCLAAFKTRMCLRQHKTKFCFARKQIKIEPDQQIIKHESNQ